MAAVERKTEHVKILQDLGYDPWEIENDDDMLSALKASINDLSRENPSDGRIPMLQAAVKGLRKPKFKEKKTTIKGDKFMGKEPKKDAPITDKSKLLPGVGKFNADDIKSDDESEAEQGEGDSSKVDKIIEFLNGEVKSKLDEINSSVGEIGSVVKAQGDLAEERDEDMRQALLAARKRKRESDLEGKDKKKGLKDKMLESVTKPVGNFLNKLIKFVTTVFVGAVVNRIISVIKNPAKLLDPIKEFFNLIISTINFIMKTAWHITAGPINFIIRGINTGISSLLGVINNLTKRFKLPAIEPPQIPEIPGPVQFPMIPLAGAQSGGEKEEPVQGAADGGKVVDAKDISAKEGGEVTGQSGVKISGMGDDTQLLAARPGEQVVTPEGVKKQEEETGTQPIDFNVGPNANQPTVNTTNNITAASTGGVVGKSVQPRTPLTPKVTRMDGGGVVPAPYPAGDTILGLSPSFSGLPGYSRGGNVTSNTSNNTTSNTSNNTTSNTSNNTTSNNTTSNVSNNTTSNVSNRTDSVDAKLSPGEVVVNQDQQAKILDETGVDVSSFVPAPEPGKFKFTTGGVVTPEIGTPPKKGGGVIMMGGGSSSGGGGGNTVGSTGESVPKFSSTDPNNMNVTVIKSIYNLMS